MYVYMNDPSLGTIFFLTSSWFSKLILQADIIA